MNCVGLLLLSPGGLHAIMPVDMAMRICLASSPLHSFHSNYGGSVFRRCEPLRPCLSNAAMVKKTSAGAQCGGSPAWLKRKQKKSVVFADSRGFALTTVHFFNEAEDYQLTKLHFHLSEIGGATVKPHLGDNTESTDCGSGLVLDFIPPAADYLDLRNRLKAQQVCLETCSVQDRLLSGTVQVRNLSFEKSVSVRITFDSWRSFRDVPCQYLNNVYGCLDTDTFSFSVSVSEVLQPTDAAEFCIHYQTQDHIFWDNNNGNNYKLANGSRTRSTEGNIGLEILGGEKMTKMEFDPFGSPRTSAGIFPEWQSWACIETSSPYW